MNESWAWINPMPPVLPKPEPHDLALAAKVLVNSYSNGRLRQKQAAALRAECRFINGMREAIQREIEGRL